MKYSKTAIGLLTAQYRSVLKKCLLINLGLFALGAVATATPANATDYTERQTVAASTTGTFENDTFQNIATGTGTSGWGGGIYSNGALNISGSEFSGNSAYVGGALTDYTSSTGAMTITDSTFTGNHSRADAGAVGVYGNKDNKITGTTFTGNSAGIIDSTNDSDGGGAIMVGGTAFLTLENDQFIGNKSSARGGAISVRHTAADEAVKISDSSFEENESGNFGGAIANVYKATVSVADSDFEGNKATKAGGAIYNGVDMNYGTNNYSTDNGTINITGDVSFIDNEAGENGGAIYNDEGGTVNIYATTDDIIFSGNKANGVANDIFNLGTLTLDALSGKTISLAGGIDGSAEHKGTTNISGAGSVKVANALKNQNVANAGTLQLDGADLTGTTITGEGSVKVVGDSEMSGENSIAQDLEVEEGQELGINNATINGDGTLKNLAGGTLNIKNSHVNVAVNNAGVLYSDPTYYTEQVVNSGIATFDGDIFDTGSSLNNTATVNLLNGTEFVSGVAITGTGTTNLTSGVMHFNNTANANKINVFNGANFDGTIVGGTINTQNGVIDAISGSVQNANVAIDVNTTSQTADTFAGASGSTIKSINVSGGYGTTAEAEVNLASGLTLADDAEINGGYYTKVAVADGKLKFSDKLVNQSGMNTAIQNRFELKGGEIYGDTTKAYSTAAADDKFATKTSLATVATTGSYSDLSGKPTLGTMAAANTADYETKAVAEDKYQTKAAMSDYSTTAQANALYAKKSIETTVSSHTADINSLKTTVGDAENGLVKAVADNTSAIATKADASELTKYAKLNDPNQTIISRAYKAGDWTMSQADTGSLMLSNSTATAAVIFNKNLTAQHYNFGTDVFHSKAAISTDGNLLSKGKLVLNYDPDDTSKWGVLDADKIKAYDAAVAELPNKYNWSNITGATATDTADAETVTANTNVYSVDATDQKISAASDAIAAQVQAAWAHGQTWANKEFGYDTNETDAPTVLGAAGFEADAAGKLGFSQAIIQNRSLFEDGEETGSKLSVVDSIVNRIQGATAAGSVPAETVDANTKFYSVDGTEQAIQNALVNPEQQIVADTVTANSLILPDKTQTEAEGTETVEVKNITTSIINSENNSGETLATAASVYAALGKVDHLITHNDTSNKDEMDESMADSSHNIVDGAYRGNLAVGTTVADDLIELDNVFGMMKDLNGTSLTAYDKATGKGSVAENLQKLNDHIHGTASFTDVVIGDAATTTTIGNTKAKIALSEAEETVTITAANGLKADSVVTPKLVINNKELTNATTVAIKGTGNAKTIATSKAVAETVKTMSEKATYTPATGATVLADADTIGGAITTLGGEVEGVEDIIGNGIFSGSVNLDVKGASDLTDAVVKIGNLIGEFKDYDSPYGWSNVKTLKNADGSNPGSIGQAVYNLGLYVEDGVVTVENTGVQEIKGAKQFSGAATFTKLNFVGGAEVESISTTQISDTPSQKALVTEAAVANAISTAGDGYVKTSDVVTAYDSTISDTNKIYSATVVNSELAKKQDTLTPAQLAAVNSGITAEKVEKYDGYEAQINDKASNARVAAVEERAGALEVRAGALEERVGVVETDVAALKIETAKIGNLADLPDNAKTGANHETPTTLVKAFDNLDKSVDTRVQDVYKTGHTYEGANTYTAAQAFTGGIKFSTAGDAQVVSAVDDGQGAVAVGEGRADTLATTATVLKSAQNAEFSAGTGETLPDSLNGAGTIHAAIVNVAREVDDLGDKVGTVDFTGAKNIETTTDNLTTAVTQLDSAIGDRTYTVENVVENGETIAESINNLDMAVGNVNFTEDFTKDLSGATPVAAADLTQAINNVAKNAQDAVEGAIDEAKQYTDGRIDGTGAGSTVTLGSKAGQVIIGKTQDNDGELEILSGIAINNDWNNREIEIATQHGNHVVGADFTAEDETISLMASNKGNKNATGMTIDNKNQKITLGTSNDVNETAYELEIDAKNGTTTIGTGKEGENVTIGKGTIVADASIIAGTADKGVSMNKDGDLTATNSALIGSKDEQGNVSGVELTANGDITASGSATVKGNLSAADGDFTVTTSTEGEGDEATSTTTMALNGDANISGKATFGDATDATKSVTIDEGKITANEVDTKSLTADNGTFNETLTVGTADKGVSMNKDGDLTATNSALIGSKDDEGNVTGVELTAKGNITASGDATIAGNLSAAGGNFTVATEGEGEKATTTMTLTGDADISGDTSIGGTLDVTGKTTLSAENGMAFGDGQTVTSIDDGSVAQTMPEDTTTEDPNKSALATVATVLKSAENAKFTSATDENHATGTAETIKEAFQNIDTFVGSKETLTNKGISDKADLTTAFNSFADNVEAGMGGEFAEGGKWSAEISNEADAPKDGYYSAFTAENLAGAISTVYSTIGTADKLQGYNGVSAQNTINDNIAGINGTIGDFSGLENEFGNLSTRDEDGKIISVDPANITEAFDNIDATLGRIHGLFDGKKVNTTGDIKSTTGSHSNLAEGTTVEMHLVSLDNAIGDRSSITNENGSNGYALVERDSVADVLSDIASQIGTAEELAGATINGVSADNTVNANIAAINSSLGDISELKDAAFAQGATLVDAVKNVDDKLINLDNRVAKTERDLKELHHDFRRGMASMAAMSALVPNSRSTGKTSLSLGTGAYGGHGAVAVGGFHYITDNLMLNAGVSWSDSSDTAYRMGVTYSF